MKGLLAPQNTFLDTIATRFDGTREWGGGWGGGPRLLQGRLWSPGCGQTRGMEREWNREPRNSRSGGKGKELGALCEGKRGEGQKCGGSKLGV